MHPTEELNAEGNIVHWSFTLIFPPAIELLPSWGTALIGSVEWIDSPRFFSFYTSVLTIAKLWCRKQNIFSQDTGIHIHEHIHTHAYLYIIYFAAGFRTVSAYRSHSHTHTKITHKVLVTPRDSRSHLTKYPAVNLNLVPHGYEWNWLTTCTSNSNITDMNYVIVFVIILQYWFIQICKKIHRIVRVLND